MKNTTDNSEGNTEIPMEDQPIGVQASRLHMPQKPQASRQLLLCQQQQTEEESSTASPLLASLRNTLNFIEKKTGRKMEYPNLESVTSSFIEWLATCAISATWIKPCWSRCYIHLPLAVSLKDETQRNSKESWMLLSLIKRSADTRNQSEWLVRIVVSTCLTSAQEKSLMTRMKSIMTSGLHAFSLCYIPTTHETYMRGRLPKWMIN